MVRNVVLICLDTVRKDYFDRYAVRLNNMSDVSFEQCRAASSWSIPSHASMMTGRLPSQHGIHTHNRDFSQLLRKNTFLSDMPEHQALGVSANVYASSTFGFNKMFDEYSDVAPHRRFPQGIDMEQFIQDRSGEGAGRFLEFIKTACSHQHPIQSIGNGLLFKLNDVLQRAPFPKPFDDGAKIIMKEAIQLTQSTEQPFFLFMNFMDAHGPLHHVFGYDRNMHSAPITWSSTKFDDWEINHKEAHSKHTKNLKYYRGLYSAAIDYLDRRVSSFVKRIQERTDHQTTFIITADHGENLARASDEGLIGHTASLSESLLHVPLSIINPPAGYEQTIFNYFSHLQLGELITGLAYDKTPDVFSERVTAEVIGTSSGLPEHKESVRQYWDRMLRCAYQNETKFVWDSVGHRLQYRLDQQQPCWQELVDENVTLPSWIDDYYEMEIREYKAEAWATEQHDTLNSATRSRLKELGYL